jgi:hypothetical protein
MTRTQTTGWAILFLVGWMAATSEGAALPDLPDLKQREIDGGTLPAQGEAWCGPTAVANVMLWLEDHGYGDFVAGGSGARRETVLVRQLGRFMGTNAVRGTPPVRLVNGLQSYLLSRGCRTFGIFYEGRHILPEPFATAHPRPRLGSLRDLVHGPRFAFLNIGWYRDSGDGNKFRIGGHWVTFAGIITRPDGVWLTVHDPGVESTTATRRVTQLEEIPAGLLMSGEVGSQVNAKGYYRLVGGLESPFADSDHVVLEGVVYLEVERRPLLASTRP